MSNFAVSEDAIFTKLLRALQVGVDGSGRPIISQEVYLGRRVPVAATVGQRRYTVGVSAVTLAPPVGAEFAWVIPLDGDIAFYEDGTTPTPTDGGPLFLGSVWECFIPDLTQFRMVSKDGVTHIVIVLFYKRG